MINEIRRIYRELDRLLDDAGYGSRKRTQAEAGVGGSYLRDLRARLAAGKKTGYDLGVLLRLLEALGVGRRAFFGTVYNLPEPIALCQLEARRLGEPPGVVAKVRDLLRLEEWQPLPEVPEPIRRIDAHRYQDARAAREIARGELIKVEAGLLPIAWGLPLLAVYGSALRTTDAYGRALKTLVAALEVAESIGDVSALGDLLQRLAYVVADRSADHRWALALAREATDYHLQARDLNSVGKTFVDRGLWLYKLGELDEAIQMQQSALGYLEDDEYHNRCAALHITGICHRELGELSCAQDYASQARELAPHVGLALIVKLDWLDARIAVDQERFDDAEVLLRETILSFAPTSVFDAAKATVELVRVLRHQGRQDAAREAAETMLPFLAPLERKSRDAAAAALDLVRCAQSNRRLTDAGIDRIATMLDEERERSREPSRSGR